jgi:hypothetical protein
VSQHNGYLRKFRSLLRKYGRIYVVWSIPPRSATPAIRIFVDMRFVGKFRGKYYAEVFRIIYSIYPPTSVVVSLAKRKIRGGESVRPKVSVIWEQKDAVELLKRVRKIGKKSWDSRYLALLRHARYILSSGSNPSRKLSILSLLPEEGD